MLQKLEDLKQEAIYLLVIFVVSLIIFCIAFYKTDMFVNLKIIAGIFYLFIIPGFLLLHLFTDLKFIEKLFLGGIIGYSVLTIVDYNLNIFARTNLDISNYLPIAIIIILFVSWLLVQKFSAGKVQHAKADNPRPKEEKHVSLTEDKTDR